MIKFKRVGATELSPDGTHVAYTVSTPQLEGDKSEFLTHIWVASVDGKTNIQFTQGERSCLNPHFSPDGNYLAFVSARGSENKGQVWVMRMRGGEAEAITKSKSGVEQFVWSPDGKRIAYTQRDTDTELEEKMKKEKKDWTIVDAWKYSHLYTVTLDRIPASVSRESEHKVKRLTKGDFHVTNFDWSPDSKFLTFSTGVLLIVPVQNQEKPLDRKALEWLREDYDAFNGRFSPDGKFLAYLSNEADVATTQIYVRPFDSNKPEAPAGPAVQITSLKGGAGGIFWRQDGKEMYFLTRDQNVMAIDVTSASGSSCGKASVMTPTTTADVEVPPSGEVISSPYQALARGNDLEVGGTAQISSPWPNGPRPV